MTEKDSIHTNELTAEKDDREKSPPHEINNQPNKQGFEHLPSAYHNALAVDDDDDDDNHAKKRRNDAELARKDARMAALEHKLAMEEIGRHFDF